VTNASAAAEDSHLEKGEQTKALDCPVVDDNTFDVTERTRDQKGDMSKPSTNSACKIFWTVALVKGP